MRLKLATYAATALVIGLVVVHGLAPDRFTVDGTTVVLVVFACGVLAVPYVPAIARYVQRARFPGGEIEFREQVEDVRERAEVLASQAEAKAKAGHRPSSAPSAARPPGIVRIDPVLTDLIDKDPNLAVAGLAIELERALRRAVETIDGSTPPSASQSLVQAVRTLKARNRLDDQQAALLMDIVQMRNLAVHGGPIDRADAYKFFSAVERLNGSLGLGYSLDLSPNPDWEEQGLICLYEHCIEHMPLSAENTDLSCPVFGHDCPGGRSEVEICKAEGRGAQNLLGSKDLRRKPSGDA
jgi:hypothetical protein